MINQAESDPFAHARREMVEFQLRSRTITDPRVLKVMGELPRERFMPNESRQFAYEDRAVPIGMNQTISQPYMVALMTEKLQLEPGMRVLEIGTGSGYQTAILAKLAGEVYTVERIGALSHQARNVLTGLNLSNIHYKIDDGTMGWPEFSPFDRILVTAAAPELPASLAKQLKGDGLMVIPVGPENCQTLFRVQWAGKELRQEPIVSCRFVKLMGQEGWPEEG